MAYEYFHYDANIFSAIFSRYQLGLTITEFLISNVVHCNRFSVRKR